MSINYLINNIKKISSFFPSRLVLFVFFIFRNGYIPRFSKPRTLNEKLNYIKLFNRNRLREYITDRVWVRDYAKNLAPDCEFTRIFWVGSQFDSKCWGDLPDKFICKANHGSGMVQVIDKSKDTYEKINYLLDKWLPRNYSNVGREWFYENQQKYLICEELLEYENEIPNDYKFFCCMGKVELVQVDIDRFRNHSRNLYDRDFNKLNATLLYPAGGDIKMPLNFFKAVQIAEQLSVDFDFIRVDLYLLEDGVYFGELTNTPEAGMGKYKPLALDFELGKKLPELLER